MDGTDGYAGSEVLFVAFGLGALGFVGSLAELSISAVLLAASVLGFLAWDRAPARIITGDVGSGFLGFVLGALAILALPAGEGSVFVVLILPSVFLADSTIILLRRATRGAVLHAAHQSHAYQRLARRWASHSRVASLSVAINVSIVAPAAWLAWVRPGMAPAICVAVLARLGVVVARVGQGIHDCYRAASRRVNGTGSPALVS